MDYPFTLQDHPDLNLTLRPAGFFCAPEILKDGVPLRPQQGIYLVVPLADGSTLKLRMTFGFKDGVQIKPKLGIYSVPLADGSTLKVRMTDGYNPKIEYAGQVINVLPTIPEFWKVWAFVPIVFYIFFPDILTDWRSVPPPLYLLVEVIVVLCSLLGTGTIIAVLRSNMPPLVWYALALLIPPLTLVICLTIAFLILK